MLFLAGFLRPSTVNQKRANPNPTGIVEDTCSLPAGLAVRYLEKIADGLIKNSIATSTRTYSSIQTGYFVATLVCQLILYTADLSPRLCFSSVRAYSAVQHLHSRWTRDRSSVHSDWSCFYEVLAETNLAATTSAFPSHR